MKINDIINEYAPGTGFLGGMAQRAGIDPNVFGKMGQAFRNAAKLKNQSVASKTPAQATAPQAQPAQEPAQPAKPSGNAMAEKLAKDWQAFVQAGGNASPALKQQIKQMWLDSGGIRAESKNNKKKPV